MCITVPQAPSQLQCLLRPPFASSLFALLQPFVIRPRISGHPPLPSLLSTPRSLSSVHMFPVVRPVFLVVRLTVILTPLLRPNPPRLLHPYSPPHPSLLYPAPVIRPTLLVHLIPLCSAPTPSSAPSRPIVRFTPPYCAPTPTPIVCPTPPSSSAPPPALVCPTSHVHPPPRVHRPGRAFPSSAFTVIYLYKINDKKIQWMKWPASP